MKIDVLVAEIGSTTTVVNAFDGINTPNPVYIGQGIAPTSVLQGDVRIGLKESIEDLKNKLNIETLEYNEMFATSSAAGGLKMTVHGLVYDMTARAAKEAALGAGGIIHMVTAGKIRNSDLQKLVDKKPNIILIAGGVDYGERETALSNAEKIKSLNLTIPVIYAGNVENVDEIRELFKDSKQELYIVDNVFPKIDELNVEPTRKVIQDVFEKHIVHAPGMEHIYEIINGKITPTPAAVMNLGKLIYERIGDVLLVDVGGATTDLHTVTEGREEIRRIQISPEPIAKRTVEGDLGVYVNMENIISIIGEEQLIKEGFDLNSLRENYKAIPKNVDEVAFVERLTYTAALTALHRHAGRLRYVYGPTGRSTLAEGKDLSDIKYVIGTGGALTQLPKGEDILAKIVEPDEASTLLLPKGYPTILTDSHYIIASLGVLAYKYQDATIKLLENSLGFKFPIKEK